jgi:DNA-binding SARP family transcriptional activator/Flp pilus assembly protein TadD
MLEIALLGGLSLAWDGQSLPPIASARARALFAYLVLNRDRLHRRASLAGLFWPDLPEEQARRRLRQALWQVARRVNGLPPGFYLLREGDQVGFNATLPHQVDVDEFDRLSQGGVAEMAEAARLYRGHLLPSIYDDWVLLEQERLRERWLALLDRLAQAYRAEGQSEAAIETACVLLQADPWHEPGARLLMALLADQGRTGEGLQVYLDLRTRLQADLGISPTAETTDLYRQLRAAYPQTVSPISPSQPQPQSLVREREIAALEQVLQSARQNQGQLFLVAGPVGIGKTHLVQTIAAQARQLGFWTLYAHAEEPFGPSAPYSPLDQALRAWIKALRGPPPGLSPLGQAALSVLLPDLVPNTPDLDATRLPPPRFHDALASALTSLADASPLFLALDDLHWADPATWAVLRALLPRLAGCPLALIAAFRSADLPDAIAPWPDRLAAHSAAHFLTLPQLSPEEVGQLTAQLLGQPLPDALAARIHRETGGNPLFVVETMRGLMEEGDFRPGPDGQLAWPAEEALPIPTSLHQAITSRLNRLTPQSQSLLRQAAILGDDFDFDLLWAVSGEKDEEQVLEWLEELLERSLLAEENEKYHFLHSLTRRVLYDETHPRRRRIWHRRAAQALAHLAPRQVAARARHAHAAEEWAEALELGLEAAEQALALFAIDEAQAFYRLVQEAEEHLNVPDTRLRRLRGLAQVYRLRNEEEAEAQVLEEWRAIAHGRDAGLESLALAGLASNACRRGHGVDSLPLAQEAVLLAGTAPDIRATALEALGMCHEAQGNLAASLGSHRQAAVAASQAGSARQEATSLNSLAIALELSGKVEEAAEAYRQAAALAAACGDRLTESRATNNLGTIHVLRGDYGPARKAYEVALAAVQALEIREGQAIVQRNLAEAWMAMGHPETAHACLEEALALHAQLNWPGEHAKALADLAGWTVATGDPQQAVEYLEKSRRILPEKELQEEHLYYHYQSVNVHLILGDTATAADHAAQFTRLVEQVGMGWLEGQVALLNGKVAAAQGNLETAERSLRRAVQFYESQDFGADMANAQAELGLVLQQAGQEDEAARVLVTAWEELARRMLHPDLARLLDRLGRPPTLPGQQKITLPRLGAPLRRHPTPDECTTILWTPNAGPLEPPLRRQHLRRARLRRLLTEAAVQGAAPTIEHLAQALNVSPATLNTDLAALRQEGWPVSTRGAK